MVTANNDLKVSQLVLPNGSWNWVAFRQLLHPHALEHFFNSPVSTLIVGPDRCIWEPEKHALWDKVLTNVSCYHRNLTDTPSCQICGASSESSLHILRDCSTTGTIWLSLLHHQSLPDFQNLALVDWLILNIDNRQLLVGTNVPWNVFFCSLIWQIWKCHNSHIFAASTISNTDLIHMSRAWALQYI
ncbi:hypothetical protein V6N12_068201 [Hibiscus sabdariffa]|uniref:Reverse transcriptase zinc-binding domain-containing protein n=1 Tax=Hibiscus sabdariffa TaxID=183260 RepID=A0ABR2FPA8_9ROSI